MATKEKRRVTIEVMMEKKESTKYYGRLLGVVTDEDFHVLINKKNAQVRLFTAETLALPKIGDHYDDFNGKRLVMTVKKADGEPVTGKKIFITERLGLVAYYKRDDGILCAECKNGEYICVDEEIEKKEGTAADE